MIRYYVDHQQVGLARLYYKNMNKILEKRNQGKT